MTHNRDKPHCRHVGDGRGCDEDATLEVRSGYPSVPYHDDYTHSCDRHLSGMLGEGASIVYPIGLS